MRRPTSRSTLTLTALAVLLGGVACAAPAPEPEPQPVAAIEAAALLPNGAEPFPGLITCH